MLNPENLRNSLLPDSFFPSSARLALAAGVVGRCVYVCVCEEQVARLDQMQASGGTAAIAPMPAFFTASLHPDSMCLFVSVGVCAHKRLYVGT